MQGKTKAARNKTLVLGKDEQAKNVNLCLKMERKLSVEQIIDRTIIGDTFKILKMIPEQSIDLLIADPPYNLSKDYHGNKFSVVSESDYEEYTREWLSACKPLLKRTASIYVCCDWRSSLVIGRVLDDLFDIKSRITWQREKGRGAKANWKNGLEDIWFATVSKNGYQFNLDDVMVRRKVIAPYKTNGQPKDWEETSQGNFRNTCPSNFWDDCTIPYWSMPENTDHPTQKPEKLIAKMILASSSQNDLVLDPFLGSGTTSVVAKKLKRHFIGIEQNEMYCAWAIERLNRAEKDAGIQGYSGGLFWERNSLADQKAYHARNNNTENSQLSLDWR